MMSLAQWWLEGAAHDTPWLPDAWWMRSSMALGWAVVLGFVGAGLAGRRSVGWQRAVASVLALWALVPGTVSVTYWLGLAFHAPSITTVLVCALCLKDQLWPHATAAVAVQKPAPARWWWAAAGVLLGYLLMLDTFARMPVQLYAWGFTTQALVLVLLLLLLPWVIGGAAIYRFGRAPWLLPVAVLVYALTRLPTGNLWDALLDPWLWAALQVLMLRAAWRHFRASQSATRG